MAAPLPWPFLYLLVFAFVGPVGHLIGPPDFFFKIEIEIEIEIEPILPNKF